MVQSHEPVASRGAGDQATRTAEPSTGSRTETQIRAQPQAPTLTLTGAHDRSRGPRVRWDENVVDNEGMGKKSSKVCCIYHAPKGVDESSDESDTSSSSSSSDDSDSDAGGEGSSRRMDADRVGKGKGRAHGRGRRKKGDGQRQRKPSPNAYEKVPKLKAKSNNDGGGAGGSV